ARRPHGAARVLQRRAPARLRPVGAPARAARDHQREPLARERVVTTPAPEGPTMHDRMLTIALCAGLAACGPATVDTVQPDAVSKQVFEGEWHWLETVMDAPYGTSATF